MTNLTLIGRLTADPKAGQTTAGNVFANFGVADVVNDDTVYFHNCVAFGKVAEIIGKYAKKGTQVAVVGILTNRDYTDRTGAHRRVTEILVNSVKLLGSAEKVTLTPVEDDDAAPKKSKSVKKASAKADDVQCLFDDDDLPF